MDSIRDTQKKFCSQALTFAIIIAFIFIIIERKDIAKGLILGTLFSIINFVLLGESLYYKLGMTKGKTFLMSLSGIFFRYFLMAIAMFIGIKYESINFFGVVGGLFFVQIMILFDAMLQKVMHKNLNLKHKNLDN